MNKKQQKNQRGTLTQRIPAKKINSPSVFRSSLHVLSWPCNNCLTCLPRTEAVHRVWHGPVHCAATSSQATRASDTCCASGREISALSSPNHHPVTCKQRQDLHWQPARTQGAGFVWGCTSSTRPPTSSCWAGAGWAAPPWPSLQRSSSLISSNWKQHPPGASALLLMLAVYLMVDCIWVINAAFQQIKQISLSAQLLLALTLVFMSLGSDVGVRPARPGKWSGEKEAYTMSTPRAPFYVFVIR